ncbi:hypothetical protein T10_1244 [Trichinella papuae]|uniref:Uncharacterized protein n=1 Tax=Trichinella papuae TaxID=268474 RepID=A0A0V1MBD0_9BILA|nr:hypothetical protein T10_1244 [Trichinella papuae]
MYPGLIRQVQKCHRLHCTSQDGNCSGLCSNRRFRVGHLPDELQPLLNWFEELHGSSKSSRLWKTSTSVFSGDVVDASPACQWRQSHQQLRGSCSPQVENRIANGTSDHLEMICVCVTYDEIKS